MIEKSNYITIPIWIWYTIICLISLSFFSTNALQTAISILIIPFYMKLLWRKGEPPVLLFVVIFQWMQITTKVFQANLRGITLVEIFGQSTINQAFWLSIIGLTSIVIGMHIIQSRLPILNLQEIRNEIKQFSIKKLWLYYIIAFILSSLLTSYAFFIPKFTQIILAVIKLKWVIFFMFSLSVLLRKKKYELFFSALFLETMYGFSGYFSAFKEVLFILIVVVFTVHYKFTKRNILRLIVSASFALFVALIWQGVKSDYRQFLNRGTGQQVIYMPIQERYKTLAVLVSQLDFDDYVNSLESLSQRLAYIDYFAHVIRHVPKNVAHEKGRLYLNTIKHILMPRLLFPEKRALSDSDITRKYTGIWVGGVTQGTSIGIGYFAESYIDFGRIGMHIPLFLFGILWAWIYNYFIKMSLFKSIGFAFSVVILINAYRYEINNIKLLGGIIMNFIVFASLLRFFENNVVSALLKQKRNPKYYQKKS